MEMFQVSGHPGRLCFLVQVLASQNPMIQGRLNPETSLLCKAFQARDVQGPYDPKPTLCDGELEVAS